MSPLVAASLEVFAHATAPHGKPEFGIESVHVGRKDVPVREEILLRKPFGQLKHFYREGVHSGPRLLIVAPMSGHYATLLRGTVQRLLPSFDVYITDWRDAKCVSLAEGSFDLDDYIDYLIEFLETIGERTGERPHMLAVCQPAVPAFAATALMNEDKNRWRPLHAHHDGRADRHADGADGGQHSSDRTAVRLVREQCDRDRADDLSGSRAEGLPRLPAARGVHDHEPRLAPHQPLGDVQASRRRRRGKCVRDARVLR